MAKQNASKVSSLWRSVAIIAVVIILVQYAVLISQCNTNNQTDQPESVYFYFPDLFSVTTIPTTRTVLILTLVSTITSGLGAVPFFFISNLSALSTCIYNSIAAGMMFSASLSLSADGLLYNVYITILGLIFGVIFVIASDHFLSKYDNLSIATLQGTDARKVLLFVGVMTAHSLAEGIGMGMSFGGGMSLGLFVNIAIALHNLPEGIAVSLVLVSKGVSPWFAMIWATISALPQPIMALPAFWFIETFAQFLPFGLGFSAGAMIWMVFTEMIPEALEAYKSKKVVFSLTILSWTFMTIFQYCLQTYLEGATDTQLPTQLN